ncbi:MAG: ABC transporter permease [Lautropia sp.]
MNQSPTAAKAAPELTFTVSARQEKSSPIERLSRSNGFMAVASPVLLLILWESAVRLGVLDSRFFPAPSAVVRAMGELVINGELFVHLQWTIQRVLVGFALGAIPGVLLGIIMGLSPFLRAFLRPAIASVYPIPKIALFPLIMMIFGLGEVSKWVIVAVAVFFQVVLTTLAGVVNIESIYLDVARNFKARRWQMYKTVAFPAALPFIFNGCQLGLGMALIVVVVAENFGATSGIGFLIWRSWQVFEVTDMYVGILAVALLGFLLQLVLGWIERLVIPWKLGASSSGRM